MNTHRAGKVGENSAADYLVEHGYRIITRNYRGHRGEIDIICTKNDSIIFCEIKTVKKTGFPSAEYLINSAKREKIIRSSREYLAENPAYSRFFVQYDVLLIENMNHTIDHLENAFFNGGIV